MSLLLFIRECSQCLPWQSIADKVNRHVLRERVINNALRLGEHSPRQLPLGRLSLMEQSPWTLEFKQCSLHHSRVASQRVTFFRKSTFPTSPLRTVPACFHDTQLSSRLSQFLLRRNFQREFRHDVSYTLQDFFAGWLSSFSPIPAFLSGLAISSASPSVS